MSERIEYGVELTWPDGQTQIDTRSRDMAELMAAWHNETESICTARVLRRRITVHEWEPAKEPRECEHGKTGPHTWGEVVSKDDAHWLPRSCPGPSPAVLPGESA